MIWLVATAGAVDTADTGDASGPSPCDVTDLVSSSSSCTAGETITLTATGCEGGTWQWQDDGGGSFEGDGAQVTWTCPEVACPGQEVTIYAVASDSDAHQDWAFARLAVACAPDTGEDDKGNGPCGCASPAAPALLPSLAALALLRRRRRPEA